MKNEMIFYLPEIRGHLLKNVGKKVIFFIDYARHYTIDRKDGILVFDYEDSYFIEHFSILHENEKSTFPFIINDEISAITYIEDVLVVIFRLRKGE